MTGLLRPTLFTLTLALSLALDLGLAVPVARAAERPNIIVIMADDLGYADLSFLPQSPADVDTPSIDRLARQCQEGKIGTDYAGSQGRR